MKREILIKYLNREMMKKNSAIRFRKIIGTYSIEIIINDPFIEETSISNKKNYFYDLIEKLIKNKTNQKDINWNNTQSIFSIWINANKSYLE